MPTEHPDENVTDVREYTRETLRQADQTLREVARHRQQLAVRLAVLDAAADPELQRLADDVYARLDAGEMLEARPAEQVLAEAHRRYVG